ncbi:WRKY TRANSCRIPTION FACTOR 14-RELATED [Salix purpurea]|uniref:WRKY TRANSCRIPTION FACTOR 14-RELATED n=1 Tax=Salix purpurea TaxID=77065 RepID=A0A9Q0WP39_SALPP|nr:WRKY TRANSCRIPTION FACTOR 14-RELATED [Salix purpurea]
MDNYQGDLTDILRASTGGALGKSDVPVSDWEFPSDPMNLASSSIMGDSTRVNGFGDPFCNMRDPLLHELNVCCAAAGACSNILARQKVLEDHVMHKAAAAATSNVFSRIQISPNNPTKLPVSPCNSPVIATCSSPGVFKPSAMVSSDIINVNNSKGCLIDSTGSVQISSPRNLGIKRRKSQAKKVVCIPAPAAANSRSSGEVVPSDLSQPTKNSAAPKGSTANTKEDQKEGSNDTLSPADIGGGSSSASAYVKEEFDEIEKQMEMEDDEFISTEGFSHNYRPSIPAGQSDQDLFAELGEIDADPLDLLFTQDFNGEEQEESKASDPIFSIFDWSEDPNTSFGQAGRPGL